MFEKLISLVKNNETNKDLVNKIIAGLDEYGNLTNNTFNSFLLFFSKIKKNEIDYELFIEEIIDNKDFSFKDFSKINYSKDNLSLINQKLTLTINSPVKLSFEITYQLAPDMDNIIIDSESGYDTIYFKRNIKTVKIY